FVLLLDSCDLATLHPCVARIREGLATHPFSALPEGVRCTMSAGLCVVHPEDDLDRRSSQADEPVYQAKAEGRNRTCAHEQAAARGSAYPQPDHGAAADAAPQADLEPVGPAQLSPVLQRPFPGLGEIGCKALLDGAGHATVDDVLIGFQVQCRVQRSKL